MANASQHEQIWNSLTSLFTEIDGAKQAAARSEPGSRGGETTHPSKNTDDRLVPEQTGSRFSENTSDVKEHVGAPSVDDASDANYDSAHSQAQSRQPDAGVHSTPTGEDPSVEDDYKGNKDDPGTSSKMRADDGRKYAEWNMRKFASELGPRANNILAKIATGRFGEKQADGMAPVVPASITPPAAAGAAPVGAKPAAPPVSSAPNPAVNPLPSPAADAALKAAQSGYNAAATLGMAMTNADRASHFVQTVIKEAGISADMTGRAIHEYRLAKQAEGEGGGAEEGAGGGAQMPSGQGNEQPTSGGGLDAILEQLGPDELQQLVQLVQSGQLGGAEGQGQPGQMPGQGAPAGGGAPQLGAPGMPTGEMYQGDAGNIDAMSDAMADMGQSPEGLEQAAAKAASSPNAKMLQKIAAHVRDHRVAGRWVYKAARTQKDAELRSNMARTLADLLGTGR